MTGKKLPLIFYALILSFNLAGSSSAQESPRLLGLTAVVQAALQSDPRLKSAQAQTRAAHADVNAAMEKSLPTLSAQSSAMRGNDPVYVFSSLLEQRSFGAQDFAINSLNFPSYLTNVQSSLELSVPIFTGFDLTYGRRLAKVSLAQTKTGEILAEQGIRYQTTALYLETLLDLESLGLVQKRITSSEKEIESADKLRAKGLVPGSDYYAAQASLGELKSWRERLKNDLDDSRSQLAILTATEPGAIFASGTLTESVYVLPTEKDLIRQALNERSEIKSASLRNSASQILSEKTKSSLLPKVDAFAALQTDTNDFGYNPNSQLIGLRLNFPIGDPTYFARLKRAKAQGQAAEADMKSAKESVRLEVSRAYKAYRGNLDDLPIIKEMTAQADKSLKLFRPLYREGRRSVIEILRAEKEDAHARVAYLKVLYKIHQGYARILFSTGRLDDASLSEIEKRLEEKP